MTLYHYSRLFIALAGLMMAIQVMAAPDYAREERWAQEVIPGLIIGEPVYLTQKNQHRFLGLYSARKEAQMGIVIAHGMGLNPDWGMIGSLRQQLYDAGYATLSIQMPVLAADADYRAYTEVFPDAAERLQLAVAYLKQQGFKRIAIVSHSNGSRMTRVYMHTNPPDVIAWTALSLTQGDTFEGIQAPILDLYGENDLAHVLASVKQRKTSLQNPASQQKYIAGAGHFFADHEDAMIHEVKEFLDRRLIEHLNLSYVGKMAPLYCSSWE